MLSAHDVLPEPVSFSPSAAACSVFLPLFIFEHTLTANTPRRHTARTHNTTDAAGKTIKKESNYKTCRTVYVICIDSCYFQLLKCEDLFPFPFYMIVLFRQNKQFKDDTFGSGILCLAILWPFIDYIII